MRFGCELRFICIPTSFPYFLEKEAFVFLGAFSRLVPGYSLL
jgi:hypothetical protein